MRDDDGSRVTLSARVCRPFGDAPTRVVVFDYTSPARSDARPRMRLEECDSDASQWFLRRGYGGIGGDWAETYGCRGPDYVHAGLKTARDIGAIVVGSSAGGWTTIAYAPLPHPKVAALIVFAGGRGGHRNDIPDSNCRPERLSEAAGQFGRTSRSPMLWI